MIGIFVAMYQIPGIHESVASMMSQMQNVSASSGGISAGISMGGVFGGGMNLFSNFPAAAMQVYVIITVSILTIANIIAARIVGGGIDTCIYFYAAIFCTLTGVVLLFAPMVVQLFFNPQALTNMGAEFPVQVRKMKDSVAGWYFLL